MNLDDTNTKQHQVLIDAELKNLLTDPNTNLTDKQQEIIQTYCYSNLTPTTLDDLTPIIKILDKAIIKKYSQVAHLVSQYHPGFRQILPIQQENADLLVSSVQHLCAKIQNSKIDLTSKKIILSNEITAYVKVILELLDVIWLIIREFKCGFEKEKNEALDAYLDAMVDALFMRIRSFHISVLMATYDKHLVASLESLRIMLNERLDLATKKVTESSDLLQQYQHLGPLFEKLRKTYGDVLRQIKIMEDDIQRMNSQ
ncbi:HAUS augmin-like complex subunit 4-domain-containing protein [Chlamydoabsidia padenii]|nr:HAUS augmin-like complex subunit 4-domain-containing protein [Chlamydoabsidia padenii]